METVLVIDALEAGGLWPGYVSAPAWASALRATAAAWPLRVSPNCRVVCSPTSSSAPPWPRLWASSASFSRSSSNLGLVKTACQTRLKEEVRESWSEKSICSHHGRRRARGEQHVPCFSRRSRLHLKRSRAAFPPSFPDMTEFIPMLVCFIILVDGAGASSVGRSSPGMLEKRERTIKESLEKSEAARIESERRARRIQASARRGEGAGRPDRRRCEEDGRGREGRHHRQGAGRGRRHDREGATRPSRPRRRPPSPSCRVRWPTSPFRSWPRA